ncbi:YlcI/YnfO family protein [Salmonella enterica]|uniref:YlcI/YnfO family protein n=2 Tax=Salmonella enterica TaxID=28901 RepID=UPI00287B9434|nr:YlcI/YnfO family protein [Salmonella enterica]EGS9064617.1 hypothetical protein [Salmonella enterica]
MFKQVNEFCLNSFVMPGFTVSLLMFKHLRVSSMTKNHINSKTTYKGIRFPHEMIAEIDACVEREKVANPGSSFSAWVLDACGRKLKAEQRKKAKE